MTRDAARHLGFTLVETLVVVVVVAVLAGMTMLSLSGATGSAALRESAARLSRTAQYGQAYAVTRAAPCRLVIDRENRRFLLEREKDPASEPGVYAAITEDGVRPFTLPRGVTFGPVVIQDAERSPWVRFTPHGDATPAAIVLTADRESYTVRVSGPTGRVELVPGTVTELLQERMDLDLDAS